MRFLLLAFALLNAALYSCFLPLWEGFDEPFHYAYIQSLSAGHVPVFGKAKVSKEIYSSFATTPLSRFLSGSVDAVSFEQWFHLPDSQKQTRIHQAIPVSLRAQASDLDNYEAQQAPLAYALLAPFDLVFSSAPIRLRVLALRLILVIPAVLLLFFGLSRFCRLLPVPAPFASAAMACIFASQMLWATLAHVGNDALAVPLTLLFLMWLAISAISRSGRDLLILGALLAAGLLTKAYFLAFTPIFVARLSVAFWREKNRKAAVWALLIPVVTAGPWYWRNHLLYGSFSGTQQAVAGIGFVQALTAIPKIPWLSGTLAFLHWSLWTGNWSFLSFSKTTLDLELLLLAAGLALYFANFRRNGGAEQWTLAACACFVTGLVYQTCVTYIHTQGASLFAEPWYWQGVVCFLWIIAFRGLSLSAAAGRILSIALVVLCAWINLATYVVKLFPMYGGGFERGTFARVWGWWSAHPVDNLKFVALAPAPLLLLLLGLLLLVVFTQTALIVRRLFLADSEPISKRLDLPEAS